MKQRRAGEPKAFVDAFERGRERRHAPDYPPALTRYLTHAFLGRLCGQRLLALGSGSGEFLCGFAREGFDAVGFDAPREGPSPRRPLVVRGNVDSGCLPFRDESFAVLFDKALTGRAQNWPRLIQEMGRVLTPGGRLILLVPVARMQGVERSPTRSLTRGTLMAALTRVGFELTHEERFWELPVLFHRSYLRPVAVLASMLPGVARRWEFVRLSKDAQCLLVLDKPRPRPAGTARILRLVPPR